MKKSLAYQLAESEITIMRLEDERDAARAEVERLRAIVDAAPEYAAYVHMALATFDTPMSFEEWYADGETDGAE